MSIPNIIIDRGLKSNDLAPKTVRELDLIPGKNLLSLSGGSTKFIGLIARSKVIVEGGFCPDIICGLSSGAIASVPIAMGLWDKSIEVGLNVSLDDFWKKKPVNEKNGKIKISAALRALFKGHLGVQDIAKVVNKVITPEVFDEYKAGDYPECYIMAINCDTRKRVFWRVKSLTYLEYITRLSGSAAIPLATDEVTIDGAKYADGGLRDHNCGSTLAKYMPYLTHHESVYVRPRNIDETFTTKWPSKIFAKVTEMFSMMSDEISRSDAKHEIDHALQNDIYLRQHFLPKVLTSLYDTDKGRFRELYQEALQINKYFVEYGNQGDLE